MMIKAATAGCGLLLAIGATGAWAQANPGTPLPGAGNSTAISQGNRDANSSYNHLIGAGDAKPIATDDRPVRPGPATAATAADIKPGGALRDSQGVHIGAIAALEADGVVVDTGQTKIKVPLIAFGKDNRGLLLAITAARFNELVGKAQVSK